MTEVAVDAALVTFVVICAALFIALWTQNRSLDDKIRALADIMASAGVVVQLGQADRRVSLEKADWCGKRKKFVVIVRVDDKNGTRRVNGLVDSLDDVTIWKLGKE